MSESRTHCNGRCYSLGLEEEIVKGVDVDVNRRRRARKERSPLPSVVLGVEQEVGADDGHADGDNDEDQKDQQHEAVDVVDLVGPEGREDEVPAGQKEVITRRR
jgi:hypothetical protein